MEENMQGESSMDEKAFLLQEIRYSKRKQNVKKFLRYESTGIAAGGTIAMVLEGCAVFVPFYTVHVWAVLAVLCGAAAGGIYTVMKRCTMVQAAQQIDRFGFQERIVTAYGRIGKEGSIDRMQRSDAVHMLQEDHAWKKARVCPDRRKLVALFLSLGLALVLSFVPSPAHKQAQQRHAIRQEAREKEKEIQKVMDALKQTDTSSMTKEQKKALQELIQSLALSQKEMQQADTKQALASAGQKLSYKYGQAAQISGADALASVLKNIQVNTNTAVRSVGNPRSLRKPVPRIPGMGKIRAVERTEVEVAMEVEAETARGQEAETEVEQETEQAADAEPDPEGEHMIM